MRYPVDYFNTDYMTLSTYNKYCVFEAAIEAVNEGVVDSFTSNIATTYNHSIIFEILDNVREMLLSLYQKVLSTLTNYIVNSAKLIDKYKDLVMDKFDTLKDPFMVESYEYNNIKDKNYPAIVSPSEYQSVIEDLQDKIIDKNLTPSEVESEGNKIIQSFGGDTIDDEYIDPYDLKASVIKSVTKHICGDVVRKTIKKEDLLDFINEIKSYKDLKNEITKMKTGILDEYTALKKLCSATLNKKMADSYGLKSIKYPEIKKLEAIEANRFTDIQKEQTRILNAFITIYSESYNTKLNILRDKVNFNREVVVELLRRTNVLTSLNVRPAIKDNKPFKYVSNIRL